MTFTGLTVVQKLLAAAYYGRAVCARVRMVAARSATRNATLIPPCNPCPCTCGGSSPFAQAGCVVRAPAPPCPAATIGHPAGIPNVAHQIWLGGGTLRWEHILSMLAIRFVLRPERYVLHFDIAPKASAEWECACSLASCVQTNAPRFVHGKRLLEVEHRSDVLRLDLLTQQGGLYIDHDAFVVSHDSLHEMRRSCGAPLIAGHQVRFGRAL